MFIAALFIIAKKWKQPKLLSIDKWINKMWYVYTLEYCSDIKRKDWYMLQYGWTPKTLCSVKKARHKRPRVAWLHLCEMPGIDKFIGIEGKLVVFRGCGRGKWGETANEYGFILGGDKNILELDMTIVAQPCIYYTKNQWTVCFRRVNFMPYESYLNF